MHRKLKITGFPEVSADYFGPALQPSERLLHFLAQLGQVGTRHVGQLFVLERVPDPFVGVQLGGVARQRLQMDPCPVPGSEKLLADGGEAT